MEVSSPPIAQPSLWEKTTLPELVPQQKIHELASNAKGLMRNRNFSEMSFSNLTTINGLGGCTYFLSPFIDLYGKVGTTGFHIEGLGDTGASARMTFAETTYEGAQERMQVEVRNTSGILTVITFANKNNAWSIEQAAVTEKGHQDATRPATENEISQAFAMTTDIITAGLAKKTEIDSAILRMGEMIKTQKDRFAADAYGFHEGNWRGRPFKRFHESDIRAIAEKEVKKALHDLPEGMSAHMLLEQIAEEFVAAESAHQDGELPDMLFEIKKAKHAMAREIFVQDNQLMSEDKLPQLPPAKKPGILAHLGLGKK